MPLKNPFLSRRPLLGGALGLGALNLLLFGDLLWQGKDQVLSSSHADLYLHFYAWRLFAFDQLRQGHLVLWNPHYLCGAPFLGGFEAALLYPPNWLGLVLPLAPALNLGIILHVFLAGFFTYLWALRRQLHPFAALTAGVVFMWGGAYYLHLFAGHLPNLCAMVWAPLIFLCLDELASGVSTRWVLAGIFAVSMQILAGHPQYVYFTAIMAVMDAGFKMAGGGRKWNSLMGLGLIYAGAFFLSAIQLWTGIEAFLECGRNIPLEFESASSFSFPPENLLTLFLPGFFGNLTSDPYWGRWYLWEVSLFMGVTGFFLVLFAAIEADLQKTRRLFAASATAFLFSLGAFTPLYRFFYAFVPFFKGFRGICKFDFLAALFLALLAGMGLDQLFKTKLTPRWALGSSLGAGLVLTGLGLGIHFSAQEGMGSLWARWFTSIHWLARTVGSMETDQRLSYTVDTGRQAAQALWVGGGTFLALAFLLWLRKHRPGASYAVAVLCVLELFLFARTNRPTFSAAPLLKKIDVLKDFYSKNPGDYRVFGTGSASLASGGYDVWEDEPMVLGRYGRFACFSQGLSENQLFSVAPLYRDFPPQLGMLRLKYRIFMDEDPVRIAPFGFKTLPRMLLVDQWEVEPEEKKVLPALFDSRFDPAQKVYLEKDPGFVHSPGKAEGHVEWRDLSTEEVLIDTEAPKDCVLLITDNYSRGWHAVGQDPPEVVPGDYFLTAIPLKAGRHHFLLEYRPGSFEAGKWVSLFSGLLYVVMLVSCFRRERPGQGPGFSLTRK